MKKFGFIVMSLAVAALAFTSCKGGNQQQDLDNVVEDGFYCVGAATAVESIEAAGLSRALLGAGFNEVKKEKRAGMYEKYVALEADKEFSLVLHKAGKSDEVYGAELEEKKAETDNAEIEVKMYWGQLVPNKAMKVTKSGLYHIILDLDELGDLSATGGKQIAITPVEWGIRGGFLSANWDVTRKADKVSEFNKEKMTATFENMKVASTSEFKFVSQDCWKIQLDMSGNVKAETSVGQANGELTTFGEEINIPIERGIWNVTLTWELKGGAVGKSLSYKAEKVGDVALIDYSNCEMELVGAAVADQPGASPCGNWSWGNVFPMGKPAKNGDVYTWTVNKVHMLADEFKIRTPDFAAQGDIAAFDNGDNQKIETEGDYKISFILNADNGKKEVKVEAAK